MSTTAPGGCTDRLVVFALYLLGNLTVAALKRRCLGRECQENVP